jgi:type IV secretion system protein TrbB
MGAYFSGLKRFRAARACYALHLGAAIAAWLEDPSVIEVMLNPNRPIWIDRLADGLADKGEWLRPADGERIIRLFAHHVGAEVHSGSPRVSAELPETSERFAGLLPPIVASPAFAMCKPAAAIFTLDDWLPSALLGRKPRSRPLYLSARRERAPT